MSNSIDPDETAQFEPSNLDPCCLQKPIVMPVAVKELINMKSYFLCKKNKNKKKKIKKKINK